MKTKPLLSFLAVIFVLVASVNQANAWYAYHYHVGGYGYGGLGYHPYYAYNPYVYRAGYGGVYGGYRYGYAGVGGYRYGYARRW